MNIRETLIRDRSKETCKRIVEFIGDDNQRLQSFMDCLLSVDYVLSQRAAWVLHFITDSKPSLLDKYEDVLVKKIKSEGHHDAIKRAILRHWAEYGFSHFIEGQVYALACQYLEGDYPIAIKAHAMYAGMRVVKKYPELSSEFQILMEDLLSKYAEESAGIKSRGTKVLRQLSKLR